MEELLLGCMTPQAIQSFLEIAERKLTILHRAQLAVLSCDDDDGDCSTGIEMHLMSSFNAEGQRCELLSRLSFCYKAAHMMQNMETVCLLLNPLRLVSVSHPKAIEAEEVEKHINFLLYLNDQTKKAPSAEAPKQVKARNGHYKANLASGLQLTPLRMPPMPPPYLTRSAGGFEARLYTVMFPGLHSRHTPGLMSTQCLRSTFKT